MCCLHHHLFADQVDQTKIGLPLLLEASWLLTANGALVAALEAALAEEDVRRDSPIISLHEHNSYSSGGTWPGQWQPVRSHSVIILGL
jgi:hypothetical protein